ncbi:MAG: DegV family protein [Candidatus Eremiobacteraeota bacterium]|nr:DegV family protein [Candidatus Eremiobacteraeota bacterium]
MAVAIVTDSTSDIEPARARELGIDVVPLFVLFGETSYRDYVDLSRSEFYDKLIHEKILPATSQPAPEMFAQVFAKHVEAGNEVVCVVISQALSGTINAARSAAEQFADARIAIVDSQSAAGGLGLQVLHAAQLAGAGANVKGILDALESDRRTQQLYAALPDLSHVVRTGRVGKAKALLGTLMKIVPVLAIKDGVVDAGAQVRTFARAQEAMIELTVKNITDASQARLMVMHTQAPELAARLAVKLLERLGQPPKYFEVSEAGPVIATHAGPGALGICSAV